VARPAVGFCLPGRVRGSTVIARVATDWAGPAREQRPVRQERFSRSLDSVLRYRVRISAPTCTPRTCPLPNASPGCSSIRSPMLEIQPTTHCRISFNCSERLQADPRGLAWRLAELIDLDRDRRLLCLLARCIQESADSARVG